MSIYPTMLKCANQLTLFGMSVAVIGGVISYKILQVIVCFLSGKCVGRPLFVQTERWFESILAIIRHEIYSRDRLVLLKRLVGGGWNAGCRFSLLYSNIKENCGSNPQPSVLLLRISCAETNDINGRTETT